jgi:hypothetical protein
MTMTDEAIYFSVKKAHATKTGQHSKGTITYHILTDELHLELFITITHNEGGGWFSNEIVPLSAIETILSQQKPNLPFPTKTLAPAFASKSVNNAGFLAAVLRSEGLLNAAPEQNRLHIVTDNLEVWKAVMLGEPGEMYQLPVKQPPGIKSAQKTEESATSAVSDGKNTAKIKSNKKLSKNAVSEAISDVVEDESTSEESMDDLESEDVEEIDDEFLAGEEYAESD